MEDKIYLVKNRSSNTVGYSIPEINIRREFTPGEVKKISFGELEKLTFRPGGAYIIKNYLQIDDAEAAKDLNSGEDLEPEYYLDEDGVKDLLVNGSLDSLLDALDFAPEGVIDLIKTISVDIPLADINKIAAIKEKTNFDVSAAIRHIQEEKIEDAQPAAATTSKRRVQTEETANTGRRTTSKYNIVSKENN